MGEVGDVGAKEDVGGEVYTVGVFGGEGGAGEGYWTGADVPDEWLLDNGDVEVDSFSGCVTGASKAVEDDSSLPWINSVE